MAEILHIRLRKLVFRGLEYDWTNHHLSRRKRQELRPGFRCDKHGELLQACKQWQMLLQRQLCQNYLHLKRAKNRTKDFHLLPTD